MKEGARKKEVGRARELGEPKGEWWGVLVGEEVKYWGIEGLRR